MPRLKPDHSYNAWRATSDPRVPTHRPVISPGGSAARGLTDTESARLAAQASLLLDFLRSFAAFDGARCTEARGGHRASSPLNEQCA